MYVKESCTKNVEYVGPQTNLQEIAKLMKAKDCGSILIAENDKLTGIVTDRDIVIRAVSEGLDSANTPAQKIMTDSVLYCYEDQTAEEVLDNMAENKVKRLPVLDREKNLTGIVSFGDLSAACDHKEKAGETMQDIRRAS